MKNDSTLKLVLGLFLVFALLLSGVKIRSPRSQNETFEITYSIPKLKSFVPGFLLRDRKVIHTGLSDSKPKTVAAAPKAQAKTTKTKDIQKTAKKEAKTNKNVAKKESKTSKKPTVEVTVTKSAKNNEELSPTKKSADTDPQAAGIAAAPIKKSHTDLYNQILNSPSRELINEWVRLYLSEEISKAEFYNLIADLLESKNTISHQMALYGLAATPSYESFSQLSFSAKNLQKELQEQAQRYLAAYSHPDYLAILEAALKSKDTNTLEMAALYVGELAKRMKSILLARAPTTADNLRLSRGEASVIPPNTFVKTLELLRQIQKDHDSSLAQIAQDSITIISEIIGA